jgi:hypothetical protein
VHFAGLRDTLVFSTFVFQRGEVAMRRIILALAVLTITLGGPRQTRADSVAISASSATVTLGNTASVTLDISGLGNGTALGTFDISVGFNSGILGFASTTYGDPNLGDQLDLESFGTITTTTPGVGTVEVFELSFDSPSVLTSSQASSFILATLKFDTLGAGQSPLSISVNALGDASGNPLNASTLDGTVTVNSSTVTEAEPGSLILLGSGLLALCGAARKRKLL